MSDHAADLMITFLQEDEISIIFTFSISTIGSFLPWARACKSVTPPSKTKESLDRPHRPKWPT